MDIFEQAKKFPECDYYDPHTGYIYHIQEYTEKVKSGDIYEEKIRVSSNGVTIGYVRPM